MLRTALATAALAVLAGATSAQTKPAGRTAADETPQEFGAVPWLRDVDEALAESRRTGRPVLANFTLVHDLHEHNAKKFGRFTLRHPLLVDAMTSEFVPVLIIKNEDGPEHEVALRFGEPSNLDPVLRYLDAEGEDVIPRAEDVLLPNRTAERMIAALEAAGRPVPPYLRTVAASMNSTMYNTAIFAMHCYWDGEAKLGSIDGVVGTRAAELDGRELVTVLFDADVIGYQDLLARARQLDCADFVYARNEAQRAVATLRLGEDRVGLDHAAIELASEENQLHRLRRTPYIHLPLTPMQMTKLNADLLLGRDATRWLSPGQIELAERIAARLEEDPDAFEGMVCPRSMMEIQDYHDDVLARLDARPGAGDE